MRAKNSRLSGLVMDLRNGDSIALGQNIKIHFLEKSGRITRVRITAPLDVCISKESIKGEDGLHESQGQESPR